ncbi:hypothetical protein JCM10908_006774 [Rhodotorula pacifica]|uniref:uncharacterized protein n=1 Tax=Rhodotorula pacifica TaxID=1495444 RepID=UPI003176CEB5
MMAYRLPLELELHILKLATLPLEMDSLHDRVDFLCQIALVHRSVTKWAQEKLHHQFLYTYRPRPGEHDRLKERLEAGFGQGRTLARLFLDLTRLPGEGERTARNSPIPVDPMVRDFIHLETFLLFESQLDNLSWAVAGLPRSLRHFHILQSDIEYIVDTCATFNASKPTTLPNLESFTFTWLRSDAIDAQEQAADLAKVRKAVESIIDAPMCTFDFARSTKSPQDALDDALTALNLY